MADARTSHEPAGELKFGQVGIANLRLKRDDADAMSAELAAKMQTAPQLFMRTPVVLDLSHLPALPDAARVRDLFERIRAAGMMPVGLSYGTSANEALARELDVPLFAKFRAAFERAGEPVAVAPAAAAEPVPPPRAAKADTPPPPSRTPAGTLFQDTPVRSGQQVYARNGDLVPRSFDADAVEGNPFFWPDAAMIGELEAYIDGVRKAGDSVGARVDVVAEGVPPGWGEPIYGKLDGDLAAALMSINAVKAVGIGDGFDVVAQKGTQHRDELTADGFLSNHAGGILGGISSGQAVTARVAFKPTSSLLVPGRSIDLAGAPVEVRTKGRHDPCVGLRAVPIVEAMVALVLIDHALRHRAQCGDVGAIAPRIPGAAPIA